MDGPARASRGFTLLEVATAIVIIAILSVLVIAGLSKLRARAQRVQCANNLRNLAVAANLYVQQNGSWPQIPPTAPADAGDTDEYAAAWISALAPLNIPRETWICPTIQNLLQNPNIAEPENVRVDYIATPFDDKPTTPMQWPRQPWFIERGNVHGNGNLIIFTDGSISDLGTIAKEARRKK